MFALIGLAATVAATAFGYLKSRSFVRRRLAYVEAAQSGFAPFLAGAATFLVMLPVVGLLPIVGATSALILGAGVGVGVAHGARDTRHRRIGA